MINAEIRDQIHKLIDKASDTQLMLCSIFLNLHLLIINIQKKTLIHFMNAYKCLKTAAAMGIQLKNLMQ